MRYKLCTNPSNYKGGAYCGEDVDDIKDIEGSESTSEYPLCHDGAWVCAKNTGDKEGILGDGSTKGSCPTDKTCFTSPEDSNGCRGTSILNNLGYFDQRYT